MWMEAQELRAEGKNVNGLIENLEERIFEEAEKRIDLFFKAKREKVVFEAKESTLIIK